MSTVRLSLSLFAALYIVAGTTGFSRTTILSVTPTKVRKLSKFFRQDRHLTFSSNNANNHDSDSWDAEEDYTDFNTSMDGGPPPSSEDNDFELKFLGPDGKLGMNIGKELMDLTAEEAAELKREGAELIERAFEAKFKEMETIQQNIQKDFENAKKNLKDESKLRASLETERLMNKIDALTNNFLKESEQSRASTKLAAAADRNMAGRGLEFGSWGTDNSGREVVILGEEGSSFYIEETVDDPLPDINIATKILVVVDESKSKADAKLAKQVAAVFDDVPNTYCETVTPFRVPPGGGDNCKIALIFSSCISDRGDFDSLMERLLKRTVSSAPPTHLVLVSCLGTGRTNKMPYSMQNLLGRKLDKKREIEEAIVSRARMGLSGGLKPLDYTVVKFGELKPNTGSSKKQGGASAESAPAATPPNINIAYGDNLDGGIEFGDATQVLFQSIALQKAARNCTFSAVTDSTPSASFSTNADKFQDDWDDLFVRIDGPELFRIEINKPGDVDSNYNLLREYIFGWAQLFEEENGKKMGLSTPVSVVKSNNSLGAVKLEFRATKTGAAYKSSKEERIQESERKKYIKPSNDEGKEKTFDEKSPVGKNTKEGGIEILVELEPVLRVRAKRCNMGDGTIVKEMSEKIILKKLKDAVNFWVEH